MSHTISNPNSEFTSQGRSVVPNILGGVNSEYLPNPNRYIERDLNQSLRQVEKELLTDIKELIANSTSLELENISFYHVCKDLRKSLKAAKFNEVRGFGIAIFTFKNNKRLFSYSICDKRDTYSRLESRVYSLRTAFSSIKKSLRANTPDLGLNSIPIPEGVQKGYLSDTPEKIANYIIKNCFRRAEVEPKAVNPLHFLDENGTRSDVIQKLSVENNLDPESIKFYSLNIRKYATKYYSGMNCTPKFFAELKDESKELISRGGYVLMAAEGINKETNKKQIFVTASFCSAEENFNRDYGRRQCLVNFMLNRFDPFALSQELPGTMAEALVLLAPRYINQVVNVVIGDQSL